MEYPFGHHKHNNPHHRRDDDEDDPMYPPPPSVVHVSHTHHHREELDERPMYPPPPFDHHPPPPPPQVVHVSHTHHHREELEDDPERPVYPPPPFDHHNHPPPPAEVAHVSHVSHYPPPREEYENPFRGGANRDGDDDRRHGHHGGGVGSLVYQHSHTHDGGPSAESEFSGKATVKVYSKAGPDFVMAVRHGKAILARADPADDAQHWYKDEKFSTKVKDQDGFPCFGLINKATGQALKHSLGPTHPVQLIPYNANALDESVLWTEGRDLGDGFRAIRMVNNIRLNVDAFHGDKKSGGVHDGTTIVLWEWNKGDNQRWKIVPYSN